MTNAFLELCEYIGDGIRKLRDHPVGEYIPSFDWNAVHANMGPSTMYAHLVDEDFISGHTDNEQSISLEGTICKVLNIDQSDFSPDVPFTAYGLDSLSAATLSHALSPLIRVSQIQLLADLNLRQLEERVNTQFQKEHRPATTQ